MRPIVCASSPGATGPAERSWTIPDEAPSVPDVLFEQLAEHGKLVIPVGDRFSQILKIFTKQESHMDTETSCHCVFVKLIGKHGWSE